jgi:hypothetical protein
MQSTPSAQSAMGCRSFYTVAFLALWHFGNSPTLEGSSFFRRSSSMNFGLVQYGGVYIELNQDRMGQRKEKTMQSACIFSIIRIS